MVLAVGRVKVVEGQSGGGSAHSHYRHENGLYIQSMKDTLAWEALGPWASLSDAREKWDRDQGRPVGGNAEGGGK